MNPDVVQKTHSWRYKTILVIIKRHQQNTMKKCVAEWTDEKVFSFVSIRLSGNTVSP